LPQLSQSLDTTTWSFISNQHPGKTLH
jgi:hypothetical protein